MPRTQVDTTIDPVLLRPVAEPRDTFVDPGPSPLTGLAESLSKLSGKLGGLLEKRKAEKDDADKLKGEAQFYADNAEGFAEGVRQDKVPAHQSKSFKEGYHNAEGVVAGGDLRLKFSAYLDGILPTLGDDPAAYDKAVAEFIQQNIDPSTDPDVLKGLLPQVRSLHQEGYARYTDYRSKAVYEGSTQAHGAVMSQQINKAIADSLSDPDGPDYALIGEIVNTTRDAFVETGGRHTDADKLVIDIVTAKAAQLQDPKLLDVLKQKIPGSDFSYADTEYGLTKREATLEAIDVMSRRKATEETQRLEREYKIEGDKARSEITKTLTDNPGAVLPEELLTRARKYDDTIDTKIAEWRRSLSAGWTDDAALKELYKDLADGGGRAAIDDFMDKNPAYRSEDLKAAYAFMESREANQKPVEDMRTDPSFKAVMEDIDIRTKGQNMVGDPIKGRSNDGAAAQFQFEMAMIQWAIQNPNASVLERQKVIAEMGKAILDRITPAEMMGPGGKYVPPPIPEGVDPNSVRNPFEQPPRGPAAGDGMVQPEAGEAAVPEGAEPKGNVDPTTTEGITTEEQKEDVRSLLEGLTPEQQKVMTADATAAGMGLQEYATKLLAGEDMTPKATPVSETKGTGTQKTMRNPFWGAAMGVVRAAVGASDGETTANEMSFDAAMGYLEQALNLKEEDHAALGLKDLPAGADPEAAGLIQLILQHEAAGNWNAVYGNAASKTDLGQMTLNEVLATQLAARRRGVASTAIGGPQFLYKTLKGLKQEFKLSGNEKFTPELQMKLMQGLLDRRGWQEYKAGKLSQRQFARRLSQEWASLPNPDTGKSYYAGDGLNASRLRPSAVYAALGMGMSPGPDLEPTPDVYENIPDVDEGGNAGQRAKFMEWNADPVGNHEAKLAEIDPGLAEVVRKAQELSPDLRIVVGSGKRDDALQSKAKEWGWSKTEDSDHEHGGAVDLWGLDPKGAVTFDKATQKKIVEAMRKAAEELGVELDIGAEWKNADAPHFAIKRRKET